MLKRHTIKNVISIILVLVMVLGTIPVNAVSVGEAKVFEDVKDGYWAKSSIDYVSSLGYINGYGKTFGINDPITEGQYIAILCRILGYENQNPLTTEAPARELEIIKDGETLNITGNLKRDDMATYTIRAFELLDPEVTYPEYLEAYKGLVMDYKELDSELQSIVLKCVEKGLINGTSEGNFDPNGESTRAQAAAIIHRILSPVEREKVKPVFATPDYEFEKLVNDKEFMQDYLSILRIDKVVDGIIIWSGDRTEDGFSSGDYGTSLLPVYNNKESNKTAYNLLKSMVYDAIKNKNYVVACYNDNGMTDPIVYFKLYAIKTGGVNEVSSYQYQIWLNIHPTIYYDGTYTSHNTGVGNPVQKEKTMYEWYTKFLYDADDVYKASSLEELNGQAEDYKLYLKNAFISVYGTTAGTALYNYTMSEYNKEQYTIRQFKDYYNESVTTVENIEVQNINGQQSIVRFGTGSSK